MTQIWPPPDVQQALYPNREANNKVSLDVAADGHTHSENVPVAVSHVQAQAKAKNDTDVEERLEELQKKLDELMHEKHINRADAKDSETSKFASDSQDYDTSDSAGCKIRAHAQSWIKAANHSGSFWHPFFTGSGSDTDYTGKDADGKAVTYKASSKD